MAKKGYQCGNCESVYDKESEAKVCCVPTVGVVYVCEHCDNPWESEAEANDCCENSDAAICLCGHKRGSHEDGYNDCNVWLSDMAGDCPCTTFNGI